MNRFGFLGSAAAFGSVAASHTSKPQSATHVADAATPPQRKRASQFFSDEPMNFVLLIVLGQAAYGCGDVGTTLAIIDQIEDGNDASAFNALTAAGARIRRDADTALAAGHKVSARDYYLQASSYTYAGLYFCDGMGASEKMAPTFHESRSGADAAFALLGYPVEKIEIPYENTTMPGYFIKPDADSSKRPLLILVNGSDGSVVDMWAQGGKSALERGYSVIIFDGPGQGAMLWDRHTFFRYDYEAALTPVVDYALKRSDVDPKRMAVQGISQGGYWVPRAVAFEHRLAAAIADPGVYDVSTSWYKPMPPQMIALITSGQKAEFDKYMSMMSARQAAGFAFRARPYGLTSPFDIYTAVKKYTMAGVIDKIQTPMFVADPDNEQFWPGQSKQFFDALAVKNKALVRFTVQEGADGHCEPAAPQLRSQRVFDWLDTQLGLVG